MVLQRRLYMVTTTLYQMLSSAPMASLLSRDPGTTLCDSGTLAREY